MEILPIERELMDALLVGDDPVLDALRSQFSIASVTKRDYTGSGFFTYFSVIPDAPRVSPASLMLGDVIFGLRSHGTGGEAILWVKDGALHSLEAFAADGAWPQDAQLDRVRYWSGEVRDLDWLRGSWGG